ncbi:MAG: Mss4p nuclear export [Vezdaea aestivalis]|nr:MAG: Mss4p nuclear export [Vezdaea aestivalis]
MPKRKQGATQNGETKKGRHKEDEESASEGSGSDTLDVEFEWFDPQPEHDFEGIKVLLKQLFGNDANNFNLSALSDLIINQRLLGSTVKVEGNESDPYAFLQILNLQEHEENEVLQQLKRYIVDKATQCKGLSGLASLLLPNQSAQVGLVLTERLLNIPPQVIPPMYKMLDEEMKWAVEEKEPFSFTHYLVLSKKYIETESSIDREDKHSGKKSRKVSGQADRETFYFHAEDELLERLAVGHGTFEYTVADAEGASDSRRAFQDAGIRPIGSMILLEGAKFSEIAKSIDEFVNP